MDIPGGVELSVAGEGTVGKWGRRADSTCGITQEGMEHGFCGKSGGTVEFVVTDKAAGSC